ncbi:unnamed protein product [Cylicocyclus nassatus]|uniref:Uncharacterized protein n=1 Tax=Cylicocyclus nassatus TaxID=53992 RepID=A0AA36H199_CYLNA|nr:unnamed protein product [Cylicocyclus nassatus]
MEQQAMDIIVASTWSAITIYSIAANILIVALVSTNIELRTFTSYWIIISSSLCETSLALITFCYVIPSILLHDTFSTIGSTSDLLMLLFYRLFGFSEVFHLGTILSLLILSPCCNGVWDSYNYITYLTNPESWYKYLELGTTIAVLVVMVVSYAAVIYQVRSIHSQFEPATNTAFNSRERTAKKELRLLFQFIAVSLVYVFTWISWQWLPYVPPSKWVFFLSMTFSLLNVAAKPTIYLMFNETLRQRLIVIRHRWHGSAIATITARPSHMRTY